MKPTAVFFLGMLVGFSATLLLLSAASLTPKDIWTEWRKCIDDRPAYASDSTYYRLRPECAKWNPEHGEWLPTGKSK